MSGRRLSARIPCDYVGKACLVGHQLRFHKLSLRDDSAKCDAYETGRPEHAVHGVVYRIDPEHKTVLDQYEGLGAGYDIKSVRLEIDGICLEAFTYYATTIDASLKPYHWYKQHVLQGAQENALPAMYIEAIASVESVEDADQERHSRELSIYL